MSKKLIKNSQPFRKKIQKTAGGIFFTHTVEAMLIRCYPCSTIYILFHYKSLTALLDMHHLTCGISSLLHFVNLILFSLLLVHLILRISCHHSRHLHSHHLSLPWPFTPNLKLNCFTNPFLHCLSDSF